MKRKLLLVVLVLVMGFTISGCLALLAFLGATPAFAADVMTIAGNGTVGFSGDGGPAIAASLNSPYGMAVAADGSVYVADTGNFRVRRIGTDGVIDTIAGTGLFGDDGDGGQATSASLSGVLSIALSPAGDILYIADIDNNRVRQVNLGTGVITNFAGLGFAGFGFDGDGGPATSASLAVPEGVAVDASGNVYIGDLFNCVVRRVAAATNIITTVAGMPGLCNPSGDGGDALAAQFSLPRRLALDPSGNLFVLDSGSRTVRRIDAVTNIITTIAGGGSTTPGFGDATTMDIGAPSDLALDAANNLYISTFNQVLKVDLGTGILSVFAGTGVIGYSGDGGPAQDATFLDIGGVTSRGDEILIADSGNSRIRAVVPPAPLPNDLIIELSTSQAFIDSFNAVPGNILMINVDGREFLVLSNATSVGLDVELTDNDQLIAIDLAALASAGGNITISGNLTLQSIAMSSLATVGGSLTITNNPALNVMLISGVTSIGGNLTVVGTAATVIDLSSLATVTGSLDVSNNTSATAIDMGSLTIVGGNVNVDDATAAASIDMASLTTVAGSLSVSNNPAANPIDMASLTTVLGSLTVSGNTAVGSLDLSSLTTAGSVDISGNTSATAIDMGGLTSVGGDLIVDGAPSATSVNMGSLTTVGGSLSVSNNPAVNPIDMASLTTVSGGLTVSGNTSVGGLDLSSLTTAGSVNISGNSSLSTIDMGGLTSVGGDLSVVANGVAAINMSSGNDVAGNLTIETTGTGAFPMGDNSVGGELALDATGYTDISGTTPGGALNLTATTLEAMMQLQIQAASFTTPVTFSVTRLDPISLVPENGLDANSGPATIDPIAAYQFTFAVPTLNRDASISFDIYVTQLDAATQTALLDALAAGTATMVTKGDAAGSVFQSFPICAGAEVPTVDGCVKVEAFDALGQPTIGTPAIVRFSNVVGHFSTWAVAIVTTTIDVTAPETTITSGPAEGATITETSATFDFEGTDNLTPPGTLTFACSLDGAPFTDCTSPIGYTGLSRAAHTFAARATDAAGNTDPTAAIRTWTITKLTPVITWPTPADLTYPIPLSSTQLNATADVAGSFAYTPGSGTVLPAGTNMLAVTFTPTDTTNYSTSSTTMMITILPASSTTSVSCPANVTYNGTAQTPCSASVTGAGGLSLTPTPIYVNNINAGTATASYTYAGDANHTGSSDSMSLTINKADPTVTFTGAPATIPSGTTFTVASTTNSSSGPVYAASGACTNTGALFTTTGTGTCTSTVTWAADANYYGATRSQTTIVADSTPPITTAVPAPLPNNSDGWNNTDVTVSLYATDNVGGTGVKEIEYMLTGAQNGSGVVSGNVASMTITAEGITTLTYFARNNAGNQEAAQTLTVQIDKGVPELDAYCASQGSPMVVVGRDGGSGVASVTLTDTVPLHHGKFTERRTYLILDFAGNQLQADFGVKAVGHEMEIALLGLAYNGNAVTELPENELKCEWAIEKGTGTVKELEQKLKIEDRTEYSREHDKTEVQAKFRTKINETKIRIKTPTSDQKVTRPGLVFLHLTTEQGWARFVY